MSPVAAFKIDPRNTVALSSSEYETDISEEEISSKEEQPRRPAPKLKMSTSKQPATPAPVTMAPATNTPMVQIKLPKTFNGDRTAFKSFMQDCFVHILHHKAAFDHDDKKIIFMLSLITGGMAKVWKENWLTTKIAAGDLGTYKDFKTTLTKAFTPINEGGYVRGQVFEF